MIINTLFQYGIQVTTNVLKVVSCRTNNHVHMRRAKFAGT